MAGKAGENIRSTDRAGILSLTVGVIILTTGIAFLLGMTAQTSSMAFAVMKNTVIGLAGVLPMFLPLWLIWVGVQLCVSAKRSTSFRLVALSGLFYLCLLAFLTIVTSIRGNGFLMEYVQNINANFVHHASPESMGAYLSSAFRMYDGRITPLPGGGLIGMLLAYPFWRMLGIAGSITLLIFLILLLFFGIIRVTPVMLIDRIRAKLYGGKEDGSPTMEKTETAQHSIDVSENEKMAQPRQVSQQAFTMGGRVAVDRGPMMDASYAAVDETTTYAPGPMQPEPLNSTDPVDPVGFVPMRSDMEAIYHQYEEPQPQNEPLRETRRRRTQAMRTTIDPVQPDEEDGAEMYDETPDAAPVAQQHSGFRNIVGKQEASAVYGAEAVPTAHATAQNALSDDVDLPWEGDVAWEEDDQKEPLRPAERVQQPTGVVHEVHTDAAIPLTGERIAVPRQPSALNTASLDGSARSEPRHKQIEFPHDDYEKPPIRLMSELPADVIEDHTEEDNRRAEKLLQTLNSFSIAAEVQQIVHGPAITRFAIRLGEGVNVNRLRNVMDNLSVELLAKSPVRAEIPIPGTPLIGIEVSNEKSSTVYLRDVLTSAKMESNKSPTTVALGKDITGAPILMDLMSMPHLLIAGATGSGKSVCINSIITSLLYRASPQDVRLILVDPKFVELQPYNGCPHLLLPVITDDKKVVAALEWLCEEMDERYRKMQKYNVRNVDGYNRRIGPDEEKLPKIIMIIDEMADLIATCGKAVEEYIKRITAKARAAGICLVLATQRPSVNVITGVIKANIPSRIAFQVSSQVDSRTILDAVGAEKLLGYGDMLYMPRTNPSPTRVQGCFISDKDVESVTEYVKSRNQANYNADIMEYLEKSERENARNDFNGDTEGAEVFDELLPDAIEMAVESGQMSISMLQRVLRVGYGRAGRLIDEMDRRGIISGNEGTKPRKTLISREEYNRMVAEGDPKVAN